MYDLAFNLRMPVSYILNEMTHEEFVEWLSYFEARPIGYRDDLRFHKMMQAIGVKEKAETIFDSIASIKAYDNRSREKESFAVNSFMKSALFAQISMASGENILESLK